MKNSNFIVRIPEPCHEDWNKMQPDEKGKFCGSCSKSVFDFSNKTDTEIKSILLEHKDQKVCGHFKKTQIDRPLNIKIDFNNLPKNISTTKAFAIALFLVFGTLLFSCTDEKDQTVGAIAIENVIPKPEELTRGTITPTLQIDTISEITNTETLEGEIAYTETYVNGGLSIEDYPVTGEVCVIPEKQEVIPETYVVGQMMVYVPPTIDSTSTQDSAITEKSEKIAAKAFGIKNTDLLVYPNPTNGEFIIKYDVTKRADISLAIYDMKGVLVKTLVNVTSQYEGKYNIPVTLNETPPGIYLVTLINNGRRYTEKIVIQK